NVLDYCRSPTAEEAKVPSERRKNRNKQPLTLLSTGMPSRQAWSTHVGGAPCSSQRDSDPYIRAQAIKFARLHFAKPLRAPTRAVSSFPKGQVPPRVDSVINAHTVGNLRLTWFSGQTEAETFHAEESDDRGSRG